jgi:serpin B
MCNSSASGQLTHRLGREMVVAISKASSGPNLCFSPISLVTALKTIWCGAGGTTRTLLNKKLQIDESCLPASNALRDHAGASAFKSATSIWLRKDVVLLPGFRTDVNDCCHATVHRLSETRSVDTINEWVSAATDGKIKRVLTQVAPEMRAVLVNAVHFRARWQFPFEKSNTQARPFRKSSGKAVQLPFMRQVGTFCHQLSNGHQWIRLPYNDKVHAMDLLLPDPGASLDDRVETLLRLGATGGLVPQSGRVTLPRFSISSTLDLRGPLTTTGLGQLFDPDLADFSRLAQNARGIAIDEVTQSVFLSVDEAGTEAAAATAVTLVGALPVPALGFDISFDRPFLIAIRNIADNAVLFIAVVGELD